VINHLSYRADCAPGSNTGAVLRSASRNDQLEPAFVMVAHSGREFLVSETMARIFVRQARRVLRCHASELVVLVHADGVELLPITSITPFTVSTIARPSEAPLPDRGPVASRPGPYRTGERFAPSLMSIAPDPLAMASMPLRLIAPDGTIATLQTTVVYLGDATFEIQVDGRVIGFIRRTGQGFAAQIGPEITDDPQWRPCQLWDEAAAFLVHASGLAPAEPVDSDSRGKGPTVQDPENAQTSPSGRVVFSSRPGTP
jgi:hypothetical protein